jgi:hypothetical protein
MAGRDDLVESAKIHSPAQHVHVLLAIDGVQSCHCFVPGQRFVTNPFALPHAVDGDAQVDGVITLTSYGRMAPATNHSRRWAASAM